MSYASLSLSCAERRRRRDHPSLAGIWNDDSLGAFDEDECRVANARHARGAGEPVLQHTHICAIAVDGQFGDASLALGLNQRFGTAVRRPSGRLSGSDVSIFTIVPALPSAFTGMRKISPPKNVFT